MRKAIVTLAAGLLACASAWAAPRYEEFDRITLDNAATNTATLTPKGRVIAVYVMPPSTGGVALATASVTGAVTVVASPAVGSGLSSTTLFSDAAVTNATVSAMPRITPTDTAGDALTSLTVREPFLSAGDTITLTVTQTGTAAAMTNVLWRVFLKLD
jgi:hypothetical protein